MKYLWNLEKKLVQAENCIFVADSISPLLFPVRQIFRVYSEFSGLEFFEGLDWEYSAAHNALIRMENSRMPYISSEKMHPKLSESILYPAKGHNAIPEALDGSMLIFDNSGFFGSQGIQIDYEAEEMNLSVKIENQQSCLPFFRKKLIEKSKINITLLGDSISEGYNASAYIGQPPYLQPWIKLFCSELEKRFNCYISLKNRAINGSGSEFPLKYPDYWQKKDCDLLIIAYGMNDFASLTPEQYINNIDKIVKKQLAIASNCEFILVASMSGNANWKHTPTGKDLLFRNALAKYCANKKNMALTDLNSCWNEIQKRKGFYALTGNGVNHPNDYGHRIYASVMLELFNKP
ncbi:MAG: SGNH/GDSL hydrolase family protein [Clostridiales bacterium]|nr:SGNH/GDSL hydrolase family protein [Clostridiales bacterium]